MYCTHCGKQNSDDMLFCGYCGKPLEAPEPEAEERPPEEDSQRAIFGRPGEFEPPIQRKPQPAPRVEVPVPDRFPDDADVPPEPVGLFGPDAERSRDPLPKPILKKPVQLRAKRPPVLDRADAPAEPRNATGVRSANTFIPRREMPAFDLDDMFLEDDPLDGEDSDRFEEGYVYEEPEDSSFFVRHVRGIVALSLLTVTVLIVGYWLVYGSGQRVLGHLYLSNNPATYATLGDEEAQGGSYEEAGALYLKALSLDEDNAVYAVKAANAYITAENAGQAAVALEALVAIDPDQLDPYLTLNALYPDAVSRPVRVTELLQQGYLRTGDERLQNG